MLICLVDEFVLYVVYVYNTLFCCRVCGLVGLSGWERSGAEGCVLEHRQRCALRT